MAESADGPAAVTAALRVLDGHVRSIVRLAIAQHAIHEEGGAAAGVGALHQRIARLLHELSLEHGTDAMSTAAEYAIAALEAGTLYLGEELETFLREVTATARATSKDLTRSTPFGG